MQLSVMLLQEICILQFLKQKEKKKKTTSTINAEEINLEVTNTITVNNRQ